MCGRYYVEPESDMEELAELIAEARRKAESAGEEVKTGEVFPSDTAAVIANNRQLKPAVFPMRWGFERKGGSLVINARSETAADKTLFRESAAAPLPHPGELLLRVGAPRGRQGEVRHPAEGQRAALSRRPLHEARAGSFAALHHPHPQSRRRHQLHP